MRIRHTLHLVASAACCALLPTQLALAKPQFIEESRVIYPKSVAGFELVDVDYDPKRVDIGVGLRYQMTKNPDVRIDLYVYPAGRMTESEAMEAGMKDLRESISQAMQAGYYTNLHMAPERKLDLQVSEHTELHGRMMSFEFTMDAVRLESRALLFYRFDYYYKLRTSTDAFAAAELDTVTINAARDLIPQVRVRNRGDCRPTPSIGEQLDAEKAMEPNERKKSSPFITDGVPPERVMELLIEERIRLEESGCVDNFGDPLAKPAKGEAYTKLKFPKGAWAATPTEE